MDSITKAIVKAKAEPRSVLMCSPKYFDVLDVKNVHMKGNVVNNKLAVQQWEILYNIYEKLKEQGIIENLYLVDPVDGCEDMVFTANQSFPWMIGEEKVVVMSKMKHESRQREVPAFRSLYGKLGYRILELKETKLFEGMGDTIHHFGRNLLFGGYGHRSDKLAYKELSSLLNVDIVPLELIDERFYHLDTCFLPIDDETVLLYPQAFKEEDLILLREKCFKNVVEIPLEEAEKCFALNAHCINDQKTQQKVAIIQKGTIVTKTVLEKNGYKVFEVDTSEFMKSGGSVFCMKMMVY